MLSRTIDPALSPGSSRRERKGNRTAPVAKPKRMSLALQGGGAFGAFTWGVLDHLLEEQISFDTVSGASAGSINAVLLASGLARGGPEEARASLARFWRKVSDLGNAARRSPFVPSDTVLAT